MNQQERSLSLREASGALSASILCANQLRWTNRHTSSGSRVPFLYGVISSRTSSALVPRS